MDDRGIFFFSGTRVSSSQCRTPYYELFLIKSRSVNQVKMTTITKTIADPDFVNWVKAGLVLQFTKEGIEDLVSSVTTQFIQTITASLPVGTTCTACSTENVLPCPTSRLCGKICKYHKTIKPKHCPSCEKFRNEVFRTHRFKDKNGFGGPSWANTDATQWSTNPWELAKCYMARDGYRHVTSVKETDLSGLLSVIINHTDFQTVLAENLTLQTNIFCKVGCIVFKFVDYNVKHLFQGLFNISKR